jgi:hypothetical protein
MGAQDKKMDRNAHARAPDAQLNLAWWVDQVGACLSPGDVFKVSREFVGAWPKEKIEALPATCHPSRLETADQISELAYNLTRAQLSGAHDAPHIHALAMFFTAAAERLAQVLAVYPPNTPRLFIHG